MGLGGFLNVTHSVKFRQISIFKIPRPLTRLLCLPKFALCHFDRKNLSKQILEWRNLAVLYQNNLKNKISPLRSFLASVEMTPW